MKCFKCGLEKDVKEFKEHEFLTRGYVDDCNSCEDLEIELYQQRKSKELYNVNLLLDRKLMLNEKSRMYYHNNKEKVKAKKKQYNEDNKERIRMYYIEYNEGAKELTYKDIVTAYKLERNKD